MHVPVSRQVAVQRPDVERHAGHLYDRSLRPGPWVEAVRRTDARTFPGSEMHMTDVRLRDPELVPFGRWKVNLHRVIPFARVDQRLAILFATHHGRRHFTYPSLDHHRPRDDDHSLR